MLRVRDAPRGLISTYLVSLNGSDSVALTTSASCSWWNFFQSFSSRMTAPWSPYTSLSPTESFDPRPVALTTASTLYCTQRSLPSANAFPSCDGSSSIGLPSTSGKNEMGWSRWMISAPLMRTSLSIDISAESVSMTGDDSVYASTYSIGTSNSRRSSLRPVSSARGWSKPITPDTRMFARFSTCAGSESTGVLKKNTVRRILTPNCFAFTASCDRLWKKW
ncbi:unnamed protein product [Mycena citricolor]|uniref:Uncharacterized protein n=1 Tax=Mycena citricolor TaxID=2018698 RepID=A0AAD2JZD9_9AGAR|nr:unnamed protein product [Mycena citricolor]